MDWNARRMMTVVSVVGIVCFGIGGCATEPIAELNQIRSVQGSVETPWKSSTIQGIFGSSDIVDPKSSGYLAENLEKLKIYVRPARIEESLTKTNFNYEMDMLRRQIQEQTESSARKWGRFITVKSEAESDLVVEPSMSMLVVEGDAFKSSAELKSYYKGGLFNSELSTQEIADRSREILKTQLSLDYFDRANRGIHSSRVTTFYAKGFGTFTGRYVTQQGEFSDSSSIDRSKQTGLVGPHLPLLLGHAIDAAFADSFIGKTGLDTQLWLADADQVTKIRPAKARTSAIGTVPTN